jgi:hypothetical protein
MSDEPLRVTKKLLPTQPGALKLARKYGEALLCVRYRRNSDGTRRYTTVELVVECSPVVARGQPRTPARADAIIGVRIGYQEKQLQALARARGATWDRTARVWRMPLPAAKEAGLADRIVGE